MKPCNWSLGLEGEPCSVCKAHSEVVSDRADQLLGLKPDKGLAGLETAIEKALTTPEDPATLEP